MFNLKADYKPTGDQPEAIKALSNWVGNKNKNQTLLGVTGSGKTFTVANVIAEVKKPTLILAHNKTLAAQLFQEFRDFFPENAVEYFVSYYDYYQPESYIPQTDTYIEKDADINEEIDKLRLSATTSLMTRKDVIIVSSVSCIYNLGSPAEYSKVALNLIEGMKMRKTDLFTRLNQIYYERNEFEFKRGAYRVRGDVVDVYPAYTEEAIRIEFFGDNISSIKYFDPLTGQELHKGILPEERRGSHTHSITQDPQDYLDHRSKEGGKAFIYPAKHYVAAEESRDDALAQIEKDLEIRVKEFEKVGKQIEAYRLRQKTMYDLEMIREIGYCKGIENYSRYFDGRKEGGTPYTLMDFFPKDYLLVVDESHITLPQVRGMYNGDRARKSTLIDYGFRLPSALDNRPLNFDEFNNNVNQVIYVSATPADYELELSKDHIVEQIIRPTGIPDPEVLILPTKGQIDDLLERIKETVQKGERVLVTTLTKRMSEELSNFLIQKGIKVTYLHSDIDTLERTTILDDLRKGNYDVLVGINLLREGLDLPEVSLIAILDADKEGFLRSSSSLIQIMGRAARHVSGGVVMYADRVTRSMEVAISEIQRRREIQIQYNEDNNIVPQSIKKPVRKKLIAELLEDSKKNKNSKRNKNLDYTQMPPSEIKKEVERLEKLMKFEAEMLNFEDAAQLRDEIRKAKKFIN